MTSARGIRWGLVSFPLVLMGLMPMPARAETRQASVGNYWFEDDATGDRTSIVVNQGDQLTFTIREGIYPPHTVDVDELDIHSPDLLLGATYTTPPLKTLGTFKLYCRPHEQRGHVTTLAVRATTPTTSAPQPEPQPESQASTPTTTGAGQPPVVEGSQPAPPAPEPATPAPQPASPVPPATPAPQTTPVPHAAVPDPKSATVALQAAPPAADSSAPPAPPPDDPVTATTLTPVGVGRADPESLARAPEPEPGSLDDLIGRREARGAVPWTRALRLLVVSAVPILGAAGFSLSREAGRHRAREPERGESRRGL